MGAQVTDVSTEMAASREHADGATPGGGSEVGPVDVVASYHVGAVSAASRRADWTSERHSPVSDE